MSTKKVPTRLERLQFANVMNGHAECHVSGRWLQFSATAQQNPNGSGGFDDLTFVDVMTKNPDGISRKICELVLNRQDMLDILNRMQVKPEPKIKE